jgi:hypothetical protein
VRGQSRQPAHWPRKKLLKTPPSPSAQQQSQVPHGEHSCVLLSGKSPACASVWSVPRLHINLALGSCWGTEQRACCVKLPLMPATHTTCTCVLCSVLRTLSNRPSTSPGAALLRHERAAERGAPCACLEKRFIRPRSVLKGVS